MAPLRVRKKKTNLRFILHKFKHQGKKLVNNPFRKRIAFNWRRRQTDEVFCCHDVVFVD